MVYLVVLLALAALGLAVACVRMSGKLADERIGRADAERGVEAFKAANEATRAELGDQVKRLEAVLARYRDELKKAEGDLVTCADPVVRRGRLRDLAKIVEVVPATTKEKR